MATKSKRVETARLTPLVDWLPTLIPSYVAPVHLRLLGDWWDRVSGTARRPDVSQDVPIRDEVHHEPVRHGKTELCKGGLVRHMLLHPRAQWVIFRHSAAGAIRVSRSVRDMARRIGIAPGPVDTAEEWWTADGGVVRAAGVGTGVQGEGFDGMLVDDPIRDPADARSPIRRDNLWEWLQMGALTRRTPRAHVLITMARWDRDDLSGRCHERMGWPYVCLPAIAQDNDPNGRAVGEALWPGVWSLEKLHKAAEEVGPFAFAALYQGNPVPRGMQVFQDATLYDEIPTDGVRYIHGVDLAYTAKTTSDRSVDIVLAIVGRGPDAVAYVADCLAVRVSAPEFATRLVARATTWPGRHYWRCSGTERGSRDLIETVSGGAVRISILPLRGDKHQNAQECAAAWNAGRIRVPKSAPWLADLLSEVCGFTGSGDVHDDIVDALAAAWDGGASGPRMTYVGAA